MRAYDYLENLPICYPEKNAILAILTDLPGNMSFGKYCSVAKNTNLPDDFTIPENYLELMSIVNCMVKDKDCPHNLVNRFYGYKSRIIKEAAKQGRVSDVYEEGNCVSLVIDNKYRFHQLKKSYAGTRLEAIGSREYEKGGEEIKFDPEVYKQFQIAALYYLSKVRFFRDKHKNDPKCLYVDESLPNDKKGRNLGMILEGSRIAYSSKVAILMIVLNGSTEHVDTVTREEYNKLVYNTYVGDDFKIRTSPLEIMSVVDRMVRADNCPRNLKNRFYSYKRRILRVYAKNKQITDVYEERDTWSILIDGKYRFHQLKRDRPNGYPNEFKGTRDYVCDEPICFDINTYNDFQIAAIYFLGVSAFTH